MPLLLLGVVLVERSLPLPRMVYQAAERLNTVMADSLAKIYTGNEVRKKKEEEVDGENNLRCIWNGGWERTPC